MSETQLIHRLISSKEYGGLRSLKPEFNLFDLLNDALREPAWSRIFSGLLDSTGSHGLGNRGLQEWLRQVDAELRERGKQLPYFFQHIPENSTVRTTVEYMTPDGRRIDIVIRILDATHRLVAVVGVENKLDSPEQPAQLADYQAALAEMFPSARQLILYLTPDGREAQTATQSTRCPYLPTSYRTMVRLCEALHGNTTEPKVLLLLNSLGSEIENTVLGETKMEREARDLIQQLWSDSDHRKALRLIVEAVPTPRKLWETELFDRVKEPLKACGVKLDEDRPIHFYPNSSESPHEIKFQCGGTIGEMAAKANIWIIYMLHCSDKNPDIGSEFVLRLMAWCESGRARKQIKNMELEGELPTSGALRHWSSWENIWTGGCYTLQDFDKLDIEGMASLLLDGARKTWPALAKKIAKLAK